MVTTIVTFEFPMGVYELDLIYLGLEINRYGPCATFV